MGRRWVIMKKCGLCGTPFTFDEFEEGEIVPIIIDKVVNDAHNDCFNAFGEEEKKAMSLANNLVSKDYISWKELQVEREKMRKEDANKVIARANKPYIRVNKITIDPRERIKELIEDRVSDLFTAQQRNDAYAVTRIESQIKMYKEEFHHWETKLPSRNQMVYNTARQHGKTYARNLANKMLEDHFSVDEKVSEWYDKAIKPIPFGLPESMIESMSSTHTSGVVSTPAGSSDKFWELYMHKDSDGLSPADWLEKRSKKPFFD